MKIYTYKGIIIKRENVYASAENDYFYIYVCISGKTIKKVL